MSETTNMGPFWCMSGCELTSPCKPMTCKKAGITEPPYMTPPDRPAQSTACPEGEHIFVQNTPMCLKCGWSAQPAPDLDALEIETRADGFWLLVRGADGVVAAAMSVRDKKIADALTTLRAQLAEAQKEREPSEIRRQFDAHLAGCAALDEILKEIGLTEDDGVWTNTRAEAAEARVAALEAALTEIRDRHIPDQPSALDMDEDVYLKRQYAELRRIATAALKGAAT